MNGPELLALFDGLTDDLRRALDGLDDWGLSGAKDGQYRHDLIADEVMVGPLVAAGCSVLSEESGVIEAPTGNGVTVVVDPVDGSTNASHGLPWYATSLCAVDDDGPLAASVTNLATGERFEAIRGEGARHQGTACTPSGVQQLSDALVALSGWPPNRGGWRQYRAYGAAALDLSSVAIGRFDGFVDVDDAHGVWDYLAGVLICVEAVAVVADAWGRDLVVLDHDARRAPVAAATPELLEQLVTMRAAWDDAG